MIGLYYSEVLGVATVVIRDGSMSRVIPDYTSPDKIETVASYRALLPYGTPSVRMSDQSMCQALILCEYRKIGGKS